MRRTYLDGYRSAMRACAEAARRLAGEFSPDVIHCHQGLSACALSRACADVPLVCTLHSPWRDEFFEDALARAERLSPPWGFLYRLGARVKGAGVHRLEEEAVRRAKAVTVLSEFSRERIAGAHGLSGGQIALLRAGVDLEKFSPLPDGERQALRGRLGISGPTLISVRRLVRRTGVDLLIRAVARIRGRMPEARLIVAGDGPERGPLEELSRSLGLADAVSFAGFVPEEMLPDYYRAADLFVLPSRSLEGFGMSTIEALASGTPVVATSEGATPEILEALDAGLLAPAPTPDSLAEVSLRWLASPEDLAGLRPRCRRYAESRFAWPAAGRALDGFYRRLLGRPPE